MPSLGSLLLLALIFVTIGFIGGVLVSLFWVERDHDQDKTPSKENKKSISLKGVDEIVSILQDQTGQKLVLRMGKKLYQNAAQLSDQQRKTLEKVAVHWLSWLRNSTEQLTEPLPRNEFILAPETESRLVQVIANTEQPQTGSNIAADFHKPVVQQMKQPDAKILSKPDLSPALQEAPLVAKEPEITQPKSIVRQIDDILQEMISKMSDAPKGVRLMEDPKGGVIVWVGTEKYSGIDMVSDLSIQNLIKSAVAEWEKRTTR